MSDPSGPTRTAAFEKRLRKRYAAERRFRALGLGAILFSVAVLIFLLATMTANGVDGFRRATLSVPVDFSQSGLTLPAGTAEHVIVERTLDTQGLPQIVQDNAERALGEDGAAQLGSDAWRVVAQAVADDPALLLTSGTFALPASGDLADALRGAGHPELKPLADRLQREGKLRKSFDVGFLERSDATDPQQVGIWGALKGSMLTMLVTLSLAFPIGVLAALYLEEFARRNRWTDLIEVSINNLAAVPSIIFGLLGLAVFFLRVGGEVGAVKGSGSDARIST